MQRAAACCCHQQQQQTSGATAFSGCSKKRAAAAERMQASPWPGVHWQRGLHALAACGTHQALTHDSAGCSGDMMPYMQTVMLAMIDAWLL